MRFDHTNIITMEQNPDNELDSMSVTSERVSMSTEDQSQKLTGDKDSYVEIARREKHNVRTIRIFTIAAVVGCAIAVCVLVYYFATGSDYTNFELEYKLLVRDIQTLVVWEIKYNFALVEQLCWTITSEALMSGQYFPNVTMPHFEVTGGFVDGMGGIMMTLFAPLITSSQRNKWEEYSILHQDWLQSSAILKVESPHHRDPLHGTIQDHEHDRRLEIVSKSPDQTSLLDESEVMKVPEKLWKWEGDNKVVVVSPTAHGLYAPLWQSSPHYADTVNIDLFSDTRISDLYNVMIQTNETVLSPGTEIGNAFDWMFDPIEKPMKEHPHAFIMERVQVDFGNGKEIAGFVLALTSYRNLFTRLVPEGTRGIYAVVSGGEACGRNMTFLLTGNNADFLGWDDLHENELDEYGRSIPMELYQQVSKDLCHHRLSIYPSKAYKESYNTEKPAVYTAIVASSFLVTTFLFLIYERLVTKREHTKNAALKVISTMFPSTVHEKVLKGMSDGTNGGSNEDDLIASFYPATTVLFADIEGFTAWSSTREPVQVFRLLETVYGAFDEIARRRKVFKVETVGDCYVAVCGMPEPRKDHAVAMVRFARDCLARMSFLRQQLEVSLGPDTADLGFRVGLHSGPVTGGVLRGQNSRFQLFGDTMNMAARMESTGVRDKVQMSSATAKLLIKHGKSHWIEKRAVTVDVKGKGSQETFFLKGGCVKEESSSAKDSSVLGNTTHRTMQLSSNDSDQQSSAASATNAKIKTMKMDRLIDWNTEVLKRRVVSIVQERKPSIDSDAKFEYLDGMVIKQLRHFVHTIASMYNENPFHNFSHASHVTLSIEKMLSRVQQNSELSSNYTNNICSDPLAQFASVLAALVHDVDHYGVSNATLIEEKNPIAICYEGKSPAENHSLALAWELLMEPEYEDLLKCICGKDNKDLCRLHELLTNAVLATDVFDEDLKESRNKRWKRVFGNVDLTIAELQKMDQMQATIVLEHLIQASDVSHTMQHWHVYIKWNEHLFEEMTMAFYNGRMAKNPAEFWYESEIGFFKHYIIPLAMKLKECKVFGVSCDEFLDYAEANLHEWELKGTSIVEQFVSKYNQPVTSGVPMNI